jgi:DUF4097 and DUF4098 domain-containing protein YvlB
MKGAKIGLLIVILAFGSTVETAWRVRNRLGAGAWGWFMMGGKFHGPSFTFTADQTESVPAGTPVAVENAFGGVKIVQGAPGEVKVALRKVVYLPTQEKARAFAERIRVQVVREGNTLRILTNREELDRSASSVEGETGYETHLDLVVPSGTAVKVVNEHGAIDVADVAEADLSGSHESVRVSRVAGPVTIQGRHGDVHASGIKGDLRLTNKHGDVTVEDVEGRVTLDVEHGGITAARVGSLTVNSAHGDVTVETVHGDLEVHGQHGAVQGREVTGRASVDTAFDGIVLEKIGGDAKARSEHGEIRLTDVTGAASAEASFDDVILTRIGGPATIVVQHGAARGQGLSKGAVVRASGDEVVLEEFRGPVEIESERAAVRLLPAGAIGAGVKVTSTHGTIELQVPAGSRFDLKASADHGQISADVPGLSTTATSAGKLDATLGGGGNAVTLSTTHGDVTLHGAAAVAQKTP